MDRKTRRIKQYKRKIKSRQREREKSALSGHMKGYLSYLYFGEYKKHTPYFITFSDITKERIEGSVIVSFSVDIVNKIRDKYELHRGLPYSFGIWVNQSMHELIMNLDLSQYENSVHVYGELTEFEVLLGFDVEVVLTNHCGGDFYRRVGAPKSKKASNERRYYDKLLRVANRRYCGIYHKGRVLFKNKANRIVHFEDYENFDQIDDIMRER